MRRFYFFGQKVVPEKRHNVIIANLNGEINKLRDKNAKLEADNQSQKEAYRLLVDTFEQYKANGVIRDKNGRFIKRSK